MKKILCVGMSLALFMAAIPVQAQLKNVPTTPQDSLRVDLNTALNIALTSSPTIVIADREIERTQYAKREAQSSYWPSIAASGSYSRTLLKQKMAMEFNGEIMTISVGTENNWSAGANLSLPLVAPTLWATVKLSDLDIELAVEAARSSKLAMTSAVKKAYYAYLLAKDSYNVLLRNYNNVSLNTQTVTDKYNQGMASEYDKLRAEVQLKNQRPNLVAAESAIELSAMQLKALMGINVDYPVIFTGTLADFEGDVSAETLANNASYTLAQNSDLRQLDIQQKTLEAALKVTKAAYLPTLALSAAFQVTSMNNNFKIGSYQWFPYSNAALGLQVPIFSGLKRQQQVKQNLLNQQTLEDTRTNLERNLSVNITNCLVKMDNAINDLASNKETLVMAEKAYSISQKQFEVGMSTWLDLSASELALTQARLAYNQSIYDYLFYLAELDNVLGKTTDNK